MNGSLIFVSDTLVVNCDHITLAERNGDEVVVYFTPSSGDAGGGGRAPRARTFTGEEGKALWSALSAGRM